MLMTAPLFVGWWIAGAKYSDGHDETIDEKWRWRDWRRAAREYRLPGPWNFLVTVPLRYMRPGHHPGPEANTQMAIDYLESSPTVAAEARSALKHTNGQGGPVSA